MNLISTFRILSRCELILLRRRVFRVFVVYLLNQVVNFTHINIIP